MKITFMIFVLYTSCLYFVWGKHIDLLPPPESEEHKEGEEEETARGLKGQANPLASLQKSHAKCTVKGMHGIKNECSKYIDCQKKGLIPASKYCPSGKFFDHKKRLCVKSSDAQCKNTCPKEGHMMPDPMNDKAYLKCGGGVPLPHLCEGSKTFNKKENKCH